MLAHVAVYGRAGLIATTQAKAPGTQQISVWDLGAETRVLAFSLADYPGGVSSLAVHSDLRVAAVGMRDGDLVLLSLPDL